KSIAVLSPVPSELSVRTLGLAVSPVMRLAGGGGTGTGAGAGAGTGAGAREDGGSLPPSVPGAGRTAGPGGSGPAKGAPPGAAAAALQVQSTSCDRPDLCATTVPLPSFTVTVHGSHEERRAWKRTLWPSAPLTTGAKSFRRPGSAPRGAIEGRSDHPMFPGHALGPGARRPEVARRAQSLPAPHLS